MASVWAWLRLAGLASIIWIPALAGITGDDLGRRRDDAAIEFNDNLPLARQC